MREAVREWAKTHIFIGQNGLKISCGDNIYVKDCKDVEVCGSATVKRICDSATVKSIYGSATVKRIYGSATVESIYGSATVISSPYTEWSKSTSLVIADNATFKDCYTKTIYQSGWWKLVEVKK